MQSTAKLFALVTNQGTAAPETCLCAECFKVPGNAVRARAGRRDDVPGSQPWVDVSGNEYCHCTICGEGKPPEEDDEG